MKDKNQRLIGILCLFLVGLGCILFISHYKPALDTWYMREDSRFFATSPFSFYDLWTVFSTPMNSMGQYRPITKVLWGAPRWFGLFDPFVYHLISLFLVAGASILLARLSFVLFGSAQLAIVTGFLYSFSAVHGKPAYWISAWHNTAVALFFFASINFRIECWRRPKWETAFRCLSLLAFLLAVASRELAFGLLICFVVIDYMEKRSVLFSWDAVTVATFMIFFLFIHSSSLQRAGISLDFSALINPKQILVFYLQSINEILWAKNEIGNPLYPPFAYIVSCACLLISVVGIFFHKGLLLASILFYVGLTPFLFVPIFNLEYASVSAGGAALLISAPLALFAKRKFRGFELAIFVFAVALLASYYFYLAPLRNHHREAYVLRSHQLRDFVHDLDIATQSLPRGRRILIEDFGSYKESDAKESHHFLSPGLDELIPHHHFLFTGEALGINDGTGKNDPHEPYWNRLFPEVTPPIRLRYAPSGFEQTND